MSIHGLYTGYTGLNASQLGIDTASHNVANANTDGFTRQRVEQSARVPRDMVVGQLGTGVSVDDISRSRDAFLDARLRGALSSQASLQVSADLLGRAEGVLGEPDLGISRALDDLWATFEDLSLDPTDPGRRLGVLASLSATTSRFNAIAESFEALGADTSSRLSTRLDSINALLSEVAELNRTIPASAATGTTPNDLLDSRDLNLDAIAEALGAQVSTDNLGRSRGAAERFGACRRLDSQPPDLEPCFRVARTHLWVSHSTPAEVLVDCSRSSRQIFPHYVASSMFWPSTWQRLSTRLTRVVSAPQASPAAIC